MSFRQFLIAQMRTRLRRRLARASNTFVYRADDAAARRAAELLCEGDRSYDFGQGYHCRFDRGLQPNQQDHLHVYAGRTKLCAINRDGTSSHGSTIDLPRWVRREIATLDLVTIEEAAGALLETGLAQANPALIIHLVAEATRLRASETATRS